MSDDLNNKIANEENPLLDPNADPVLKRNYFNRVYKDREIFAKDGLSMGFVRDFDDFALILDKGRINLEGLRMNFYHPKH